MRYPLGKIENESETTSNKHQVAKICIQKQNISAFNGVFPLEISPFRNNKFSFSVDIDNGGKNII